GEDPVGVGWLDHGGLPVALATGAAGEPTPCRGVRAPTASAAPADALGADPPDQGLPAGPTTAGPGGQDRGEVLPRRPRRPRVRRPHAVLGRLPATASGAHLGPAVLRQGRARLRLAGPGVRRRPPALREGGT